MLKRHFLICLELEGQVIPALHRVWAAGTKTHHFEDLPPGAETLGGAIGFLYETIGFSHRETALLREWRAGRRPSSDTQLEAAYESVRQAYSTYTRRQRRAGLKA